VLERFKKDGYQVGYLDIFEAVSVRELSERIVETLLSNERLSVRRFFEILKKDVREALSALEFKAIFEDYKFVLSFSSKDVDEYKLFDEALDFIQEYSQRKGRVIFAIDEFSDLLRWDTRLLKKMRSKFQRQRDVTYIFAGSQESLMKDIFNHKSFAFYGFGIMMHLPPLPKDGFAEYIYRKFKDAGFKIEKDTAYHIVNRTDSHPHYTKLYAQTMADMVEEGGKISIELLDEAFDIALLRIRGEFDKEWQALSSAPLQRKILKIISRERISPYKSKLLSEKERSQIYFALTELEKKGIIRKKGRGKYEFYNPFFARYIELLESKYI
jgi:hypothetical protein